VSEDDDPTPPPRPSISPLACWSLFLKTLQPQQDTCTPNEIATTWPTSWVCMGLGFSKNAYTVDIHMYSNVTNLELPVCSSHHHQQRRRRRKRKGSCQVQEPIPRFPCSPFQKDFNLFVQLLVLIGELQLVHHVTQLLKSPHETRFYKPDQI